MCFSPDNQGNTILKITWDTLDFEYDWVGEAIVKLKRLNEMKECSIPVWMKLSARKGINLLTTTASISLYYFTATNFSSLLDLTVSIHLFIFIQNTSDMPLHAFSPIFESIIIFFVENSTGRFFLAAIGFLGVTSIIVCEHIFQRCTKRAASE